MNAIGLIPMVAIEVILTASDAAFICTIERGQATLQIIYLTFFNVRYTNWKTIMTSNAARCSGDSGDDDLTDISIS